MAARKGRAARAFMATAYRSLALGERRLSGGRIGGPLEVKKLATAAACGVARRTRSDVGRKHTSSAPRLPSHRGAIPNVHQDHVRESDGYDQAPALIPR